VLVGERQTLGDTATAQIRVTADDLVFNEKEFTMKTRIALEAFQTNQDKRRVNRQDRQGRQETNALVFFAYLATLAVQILRCSATVNRFFFPPFPSSR